MIDDEDIQLPPVIMEKLGLLYDFLKTPKGISFLLVFIAIMFNAVFLFSEMMTITYYMNDEILHLTNVQEISDVIQQGLNPTDFWVTHTGLGFPLFQYYQHFSYILLAYINQITIFIIPLPYLFNISQYLLLVFFPLSIFWSMRKFGFDYEAAGISSLVASLISTNGLFGIEYGSYLWSSYGLYTQLWAMFFLPLALSEICHSIKNEGSLLWPVILSSIVLLSNLIYGYILILSTILFIFLILDVYEFFVRLKRITIIYIFTALVTSYFFVTLTLNFDYFSRSIYLSKYNSVSAIEVLNNLFTGNLFDYGRFPILTILFFLAIIVVITQWKSEKYRLILLLTFFWMLLYFGRLTWGELSNLLPFSQDLHFHRFIGGFQLGAVMIIGAGLSLIWQWVKEISLKRYSYKIPIIVGIIFLLILSPVFIERAHSYQLSAQWKNESQNNFLSKNQEFSSIKDTLQKLPIGRVYAGMANSFGNYPYYKIGYIPLYHVLPQMDIETFGYAYTGFDFSTDVRLDFDNTKVDQYNLFNIRYVLLHKTWTPANYYIKIKEFDDFTLYKVPTTGYFDLVDVPAIFYGDKNNIYNASSKWLSSSLLKLNQYPILELGSKPLNTSGLPTYSFNEVNSKILSNLSRIQPIGGKILDENLSMNKYQVDFTANRECYLLLKTNYHPGLNAILDGKKVPTVMLTPGFIGIKVSQGTHNATFTYEPPFYRLPLFIIGVISLIVLGLHQIKFFEGRFYQNIVAYLIHIYKYE